MKRKLGSEMKKLIFWATFFTLLLFISVISYFLVDVAVTTSDNIEQNKQMMIDQAVQNMKEMGDSITGMSTNTALLKYFNPELMNNIMRGDYQAFNEMGPAIAINFYPIEYIGLIQGGELIASGTAKGLELDPATLSTEVPESGYVTLDQLGDKEGYFISAYFPVNLSLLGMQDIYANFIVDRTAELKTIEDTLEKQRSDLLVRLTIVEIVAIILFALLTTLGLRFLVNKYVMKPVNNLNEAAEGIVTGTFEGELEYDPKSSFAPIQGLLRSGQKVLSQMDDELGE